MLRVYADKTHYSQAHRKSLNDILKALWNDGELVARVETYGVRVTQFAFEEDPRRADLHLLPMRWQHYQDLGRIGQVEQALAAARDARRPFVVFSLGDFAANLPFFGSDIHLFEMSGYRSRGRVRVHGMPPFFDDPLSGYSGGELTLRAHQPIATVGFCGQAGSSWPLNAARAIRAQLRRVSWRVGIEKWEPAPVEHTVYRQRVLEAFERSTEVKTNYVLRAKYRAGVHTADKNDPKQSARKEFLDNVAHTDYTACVRGRGNFSVRFYEALAMGRLPAFVDTDCVLPFERQIDWRRFTAWVDAADATNAASVVAQFHRSLTADDYRRRQQECRDIWLTRLTPDGFYGHFRDHFPELDS